MLKEHQTGEAFKRTAKCRDCKGQIVWALTPRGKRMPLDAHLIPQHQMPQGAFGWILVWEDNLGKSLLTTERASAGIPYVVETHFVTCPGKVSLAEAQRVAAKAPYYAQVWADNGGADLASAPPPGPPSHPTDPSWIHDTAETAVSAPQQAEPIPTPTPAPARGQEGLFCGENGHAALGPHGSQAQRSQSIPPPTPAPARAVVAGATAATGKTGHSPESELGLEDWMNQDWRCGQPGAEG